MIASQNADVEMKTRNGGCTRCPKVFFKLCSVALMMKSVIMQITKLFFKSNLIQFFTIELNGHSWKWEAGRENQSQGPSRERRKEYTAQWESKEKRK